jgi:hypothetical protein
MKQDAHNEHDGLSETTRHALERSNHTLHVPDGYFEANASLLESAMQEQFKTPPDFFENQAAQLESSIIGHASTPVNGRVFRLWHVLAAAAVVTGVVFLVIPEKKEATTFAEELEQAQLEYEDLEEIELDEVLYEELVVLDTLPPDTISIKKMPASVLDFKPSQGQNVISWDDLEVEDIQEYLKDEQSLNIIDEL